MHAAPEVSLKSPASEPPSGYSTGGGTGKKGSACAGLRRIAVLMVGIKLLLKMNSLVLANLDRNNVFCRISVRITDNSLRRYLMLKSAVKMFVMTTSKKEQLKCCIFSSPHCDFDVAPN